MLRRLLCRLNRTSHTTSHLSPVFLCQEASHADAHDEAATAASAGAAPAAKQKAGDHERQQSHHKCELLKYFNSHSTVAPGQQEEEQPQEQTGCRSIGEGGTQGGGQGRGGGGAGRAGAGPAAGGQGGASSLQRAPAGHAARVADRFPANPEARRPPDARSPPHRGGLTTLSHACATSFHDGGMPCVFFSACLSVRARRALWQQENILEECKARVAPGETLPPGRN